MERLIFSIHQMDNGDKKTIDPLITSKPPQNINEPLQASNVDATVSGVYISLVPAQ